MLLPLVIFFAEIETSAKKIREILLDNFQDSKTTSFLATNDMAETVTDVFRMENNENIQLTDDALNGEFLKENIRAAFPRVKEGTYDRY